MTSISVNSPVVGHAPDADRNAVWGGISWGPILMGAVTAIGVQFIFTVLGLAIGASSVRAGTDDATARGVSVAAGAWWLITGTISLAIGGYAFGRLAGLVRSLPLKLEAVAMWAVVALFGFLVVWSGAGMLSEASPMSAMSVDSSARSSRRSTTEAGSTSGVVGTDRTRLDAPTAEEARRAARTASWWSVVGLLAGVAATVGAACAGAPADARRNARTERTT